MQTQLTNDPKQLKVFIHELTKENKLLREQVKLLKHYRCSSHTESLISPDQLPLLNQDLKEFQTLIKQDKHSIEIKAHKRKAKRRSGFDDNLHVERVILDVNEDQKTCGGCQTPLTQIGSESTKKVEYVPASIKVIEYLRLKYACPHCKKTIRRAKLPKFILPKSFATPSLLAHIFVSKFADHQPYNRIEQQLKRQKIYLPKQTMVPGE